MARDDQQMNFRIPSELKDWLVRQAEKSRRTLTAELIVAIEEYRARNQQQEGADAKATP